MISVLSAVQILTPGYLIRNFYYTLEVGIYTVDGYRFSYDVMDDLRGLFDTTE